MNQQDFNKVIRAIPDLHIRKLDNLDVEMLFKILYWCALRPMEGIRLSKNDININDRVIRLGKTKTKKNDKAIIPQQFISELYPYINSKPEGRLFDGLKYITFYFWLRRLGVMLNIDAWTSLESETGEKTKGHIFRKSIGKDMVTGEIKDKNGNKIEIPVISQHLRHAKPSMTIDHYLKATSEQVKNTF
ncbi:MAG TPA: site-specific integrase [Flavobacteriaceae bacterium]|nr:site-specific integrase [Flavobacteriaceae bacterium]